MTFDSSTRVTALPLIRSSAWCGTPDLVTDRLKPVEILSLELPLGKSKCLAGERQRQLLSKALRIILKIGIHVHGVRKITGIPHHVISNPKAVNKSLPLVEAVRAALRLFLYDHGAALHNPTLVFGYRAHAVAERQSSVARHCYQAGLRKV
jgi:hypothetical protein